VTKNSASGFSLVELAISLVVIGLLVGGILKGSELAENARLSRAIRQVQGYEGAMATFKDSYGSFPGDIANPDTRLPNCSTAACVPVLGGASANGNGNGIIEPVATYYSGGPWALGEERNYIYSHLSVTGMVPFDLNRMTTGVSKDNYPDGAIPNSQIYITQMNMPAAGVIPKLVGIFIMVSRYNTGAAIYTTLTPSMRGSQARMFDEKIDDGLPASGNVMGIDTSGAGGIMCINTSNLYEEKYADKANCNILYKTALQ